MRKARTDYLLWLAVTGVLFAVFGAVGLPPLDLAPRRLGWLALNLGVLAVPAAIIGWFVHAIAVDCGFRLSRRPPADYTADYDDAPPSPPAR
jgi:hypothetical protein